MQTDTLTPVTLQGRGLVERGGDYYEPGEYSRFQNLDITPQGTIKKRLSAQGYKYNAGAGSKLDRIIGHYEENPVFAYYDQLIDTTFIMSTDELSVLPSGNSNYVTNFKNPVFATAALDASHVNRTISVEGFFKYNKNQYVISHASGWFTYNDAFGTPMISYQHKVVVSKADTSNYDYFVGDLGIYNSAHGLAFGVDPIDFRDADANKAVLRPFVTCFLFHKDRLVIAAEDTVYLSKATDPLTFTPASGGAFFKFPDKRINKVVALGDNIYVIFDSSIAVLTYNTDPNTDGQVRLISDAVGGEDAAIYGDTIYVVRASDIYAVNGTNVTKVADINARNMMTNTDPVTHTALLVNVMAGTTYQVKCAAYDGYLYIINRLVKKVSNTQNKSNLYYCALNDDNYPAYKLNLETGTLTKLVYNADKKLPVADLIYIPVQGREHDKIVMVSRTPSTADQIHTFYHSKGNRFRYGVGVNDFYADLNSGQFGIDSFSTANGATFNTYPIPIVMQLQGLSPAHLRYMVNKFRSLKMQAALPQWHYYLPSEGTDSELELIVDAGRALSSYDTGVGNLVTVLTPNDKTVRLDPDGGTSESPIFGNADSYRYGFNQRAKTITLTIRTRSSVVAKPGVWTDYTPGLGGSTYVQQTFFELVDLAMLWTPTRRGPTNKRDSFL